MDDYSKYPVSLAERRGETAAEWTPRDVLIRLLREIDNGEHPNLDCIVVSYREKDPADHRGATISGFLTSGPDIQTSLGVLQATMFRMWNDN